MMEAARRTREYIGQVTRSSPEEVARWGSVPGHVVIDAQTPSARTPNGQLALFTAVNLFSRLYPVVTKVTLIVDEDLRTSVSAPLFTGHTVRTAVLEFVRGLQGACEVTVAASQETPGVVVSLGGFAEGHTQFSFGSDGWNALLSRTGAVACTDQFNPVGSMAAACLVTAEVFKRVFSAKATALGVIPGVLPAMKGMRGACSFSTFTYTSSEGQPNPPLPEVLDLGHLTVIGAGAGGGACLYALATLDLAGHLWVVDPDVVNLPNLNRYLYALHADAESLWLKTTVVERLFASRDKLTVHTFPLPFLEFKDQQPGWPKALVLSTVDKAQTRREIQWELPGILLDAAVESSRFYAHRAVVSKSACLVCTHGSVAERPDPIMAVAEDLGVRPEWFINLHLSNKPMSAEERIELEARATAKGIPGPKEGMTVSDWVALHCGQLRVDGGIDLVLPVPFATVLPGVLLAGEVIKEKYFPSAVLRDRVSHDVFQDPSIWLVHQLSPVPTCGLCGDSTVVERYVELYGG